MGKWKRGWQEERRHTLSRGRMESMWLDNSSVRSRSTNAHWALTMRRSHRLEESGHIYAGAWREGGTRLLTALTGSLHSGPMRSISRTSSYCSLRATRVYDSRDEGLAQGLEARQSQRAITSTWTQVCGLSQTSQWEEEENFPWSRDRMSNAIFKGA